MKGLLRASALHVTEPDGTSALPVARLGEALAVVEAQLSTEDGRLAVVPVVVADRAPAAVHAHLHAAEVVAASLQAILDA